MKKQILNNLDEITILNERVEVLNECLLTEALKQGDNAFMVVLPTLIKETMEKLQDLASDTFTKVAGLEK